MNHNKDEAMKELIGQFEQVKNFFKRESQKPAIKAAYEKGKSKLTQEELSTVQVKVKKIAGLLKDAFERKKNEIETADFLEKSRKQSPTVVKKTKKSFRTGRV